ncbi:MAG: anti-sigma factor family protein [Pseudomonadales bacterium]
MAQDREQQAQDWLDGQLDPQQAQAFEQSLRGNTQLQSYLNAQQAYRDALRSMAACVPPTGLTTRLLVKARWHGIKQTLLPVGTGFAGGTFATLFALWLLLPGLSQQDPTQTTQLVTSAAINNSAPLVSQMAYWQPAESGAVAVVNLEASTDKPLVSVRVILPPEVEMEGFPGYDIVEWDTPILRGSNKLLLPLIGHDQASEQNIRIELLYDGNKTQTFQLPANAQASDYIF